MKISKKTGRLIVLACVFVVVSILLFCIDKKPTPSPGDTKNEIRIGAVLPLTGASAWNGSMFKQGLDMAVNEINDMDLPFSFVIELEDSQSSAVEGPVAYSRLSSKGIKYFVAHGGQYIIGFAVDFAR